jgi:hypothetical protein
MIQQRRDSREGEKGGVLNKAGWQWKAERASFARNENSDLKQLALRARSSHPSIPRRTTNGE